MTYKNRILWNINKENKNKNKLKIFLLLRNTFIIIMTDKRLMRLKYNFKIKKVKLNFVFTNNLFFKKIFFNNLLKKFWIFIFTLTICIYAFNFFNQFIIDSDHF